MAATTTKTAKRKSTDATEQSLKKIKVAKSADRPAPLKSALKKADDAEESIVDEPTVQYDQAKGTSGRAKKRKPAEEELLESDDEQGESTALTPDQTAALLAGFSSSEEEDNEEEGIPVASLPKAPTAKTLNGAGTDGAIVPSTTETDPETTPGVIYIGRVPHGFYERQMRAYFGQFGKITHLRLARNKKTARSKHYAFVEFESAAVADIVAKTMDKYLLFNHILQVRRVPSEQVKDTIWRGEGRKRAMPLNRIQGTRLRKGTTKEGWEKRISRENRRRATKTEKLKELGYEFEAPTLKGLGESNEDISVDKAAAEQLQDDVKQAAIEAPAVQVPADEVVTKKRKDKASSETRKTKKSKVKA